MAFHVFVFLLLCFLMLSPLVAFSPFFAPSRPSLLKSWSSASRDPSSSEAPLPARLPHLLPFLHRLSGCGSITSAGAALERGQKPTRCTQAHRHARLRLPQPPVHLPRHHRRTHPRFGRRWQARPGRAHPDVSRSCLPHHLQCTTSHSPVPSFFLSCIWVCAHNMRPIP